VLATRGAVVHEGISVAELRDETTHRETPRARPPSRRPRRLVIVGALVLALTVAIVVAVTYGPRREPGGSATMPIPTSSTAGSPGSNQSGVVVTIGAPGKLAWAPPILNRPRSVVVGPGNRSLKLNPSLDYRVVLPNSPVDLGGGVTIVGGRNVVIIGGVIAIPSRDEVPSDNDRRGLYLKGQTGTVHIEGVHITGDISDGINLDQRKNAVVQIENVLIDRVHGSAATHHADVIQTWAGPRVLRVDGLRATTEYQGLFLLPNQLFKAGPPKEFTIRRSLITMTPGSGYAIWLPDREPAWFDCSGLFLQVPAGKSLRKLTWPDSQLRVNVVDEIATVSMDQGNPGPLYRSPGYDG
jgi:hypothetical protein